MGINVEHATATCITFRRVFSESVPVFSMQSPQSLTGNHERDLSSCIRLSFDPKDSWQNDIYENSRYATFMVDWAEKKIRLLTSWQCEKFRQTSFKDPVDLAAKLSKFIAANKRHS